MDAIQDNLDIEIGRLKSAIYHKNIEEIQKIIKAHPHIINRDVINHYSVLSYSVLQDLPPHLIEFLIGKGADVNKCEGWPRGTPLIWSLIRNIGESPDFETATLLIKNGAHINYTGGNCPTALVAVIKDAVGAKDRSYHPNQVAMKKRILDFLFYRRDSEGRGVELDCHYKDKNGLTIFELAENNDGEDFKRFLRKKCNEPARNITAAKAAWNGNSSGSSLYGQLPEEVLMGPIAQFLGAPPGKPRKGRPNSYPNPAFIVPTLKSGVQIPKGQERELAELYKWARNVRLGTSKARATDEAARSLVRLSQWPYNPSQGRYYVSPTGKTVTRLAEIRRKGGRRRITRRRR